MTDNLLQEIQKEIVGLDHNNILNSKIRTHISLSLTDFVRRSIQKYIMGQKEHGPNDIRDRNLDIEIQNEITDIFWYNEAKNWKDKDIE